MPGNNCLRFWQNGLTNLRQEVRAFLNRIIHILWQHSKCQATVSAV